MGRGQSQAGRAMTGRAIGHKVANSDRPTWQANRLHQLMPRDGLRYPFSGSVSKRCRYDAKILFTMTGFELANRKEVQSMVVGTFDVATEMVISGDEPDTPADLAEAGVRDVAIPGTLGGLLPVGPLVFLNELFEEIVSRENKKGGWVFELRFKAFAALFLILRSARLRWHLNPHMSYKIGSHCALTRSIDEFNEKAGQVD